MQKKYFISFGGPTENWHNRVKNICKQVDDYWKDFECIAYTEKDLEDDKEFWDFNSSFFSNKRGFGYWLWKPYIIYKTLQKLDDNDVLVYADAGCTINPSIQVLHKYIRILNENDFGMISWELPTDNLEVMYTKSLLFEFLQTHKNDVYSPQIMATYMFIKKTQLSIEFVEQWLHIASMHKYIDDNLYENLKYKDFIDHRHDQSIFSLLIKKYRRDSVVCPIVIKIDPYTFCNEPIDTTRIRG